MKQKSLTKKVYQYTAVFEPDKEVGGYSVSIPFLPGCFSEGETFEKALSNIQEAASLYLEVMKKNKEKILREESGVIIAPVQIRT